ncbi:MAG: hypothetical protein WBD75_04455 [Phycisphaerae bacterium]
MTTMPKETALMKVGMCIGVVFSRAYPVFLLVWFLRGKIREEMASWRSGQV